MSIDLGYARVRFRDRFGGVPGLAVRAPGRVNIIGEHTDYNDGFVLPMAIDQETAILARPRPDNVLEAYAANLDESGSVALDRFERNTEQPWLDYIVGVARELDKLGKSLHGADMLIIGDVPIGAGLSSSASLEMAALVLFETLGGYTIQGADAPKLGRRVENEFLGVNSGIMDQFIVRMGKAGHALFLDCRDHQFELVPVTFGNARFVIANTHVARGLTSSKYNERVAECMEAVKLLAETTGKQGRYLRDFCAEDLDASKEVMPDNVLRRARHVISENGRTVAACDAMRRGDAAALGQLMNASGDSLRDDYEVTCPELDAMTAVAQALPGCYGARMTGAGFGGCTVNLVEIDRVEAFCAELTEQYRRETGIEGSVIVSSPAEGAGPLEV